MIKNATKNYFNNAIKTNEHPTALWRNLKSLVSNTSTHKPLPSSMIFNEKQVNNKQNIVDSLNKHFVNIEELKHAKVVPVYKKGALMIHIIIVLHIKSM